MNFLTMHLNHYELSHRVSTAGFHCNIRGVNGRNGRALHSGCRFKMFRMILSWVATEVGRGRLTLRHPCRSHWSLPCRLLPNTIQFTTATRYCSRRSSRSNANSPPGHRTDHVRATPPSPAARLGLRPRPVQHPQPQNMGLPEGSPFLSNGSRNPNSGFIVGTTVTADSVRPAFTF